MFSGSCHGFLMIFVCCQVIVRGSFINECHRSRPELDHGILSEWPIFTGKNRVVRWSCSGTLGAPSPGQLSTPWWKSDTALENLPILVVFLTLSNFGGRSILFCLLWGSGGRVRSSAALLRGGPKSACKSGHLGRFETSRVVVALCDIATCFKNMSKS